MKILALDTSSKTASAAAWDGELRAEFTVQNGLTHSETILPMVQRVIETAGWKPADLTGIAVAVGPGSFTGVRIGVALAKSMAQALEIPVCPVNTLDMLAMNASACDGRVCSVMDARRRQVYAGVYKTGNSLERIKEPRAVALSDLVQELLQQPGRVWFTGDASLVYRREIEEMMGERAAFLPAAH